MLHTYKTHITWTGNTGSGTASYTEYERSHTLHIEQKQDLAMSSDIPFRGDGQKHNPEDLLLASLSSCHMLWYLHVCADAGVIVLGYEDQAEGQMETGQGQPGRFVSVTLKPTVRIASSSSADLARELHKKAHEQCFIANSMNFPVHVNPEIMFS